MIQSIAMFPCKELKSFWSSELYKHLADEIWIVQTHGQKFPVASKGCTVKAGKLLINNSILL